MKIVATRADVQVTMSLGNNIVGLGRSSLPIFSYFMGLSLLLLHLLSLARYIGETEVVAEPKSSDCAALRPLALKIAKVYKPCALVVKKTELMEGVADTHDIRAKSKEDIVDWLTRVLYKLSRVL